MFSVDVVFLSFVVNVHHDWSSLLESEKGPSGDREYERFNFPHDVLHHHGQRLLSLYGMDTNSNEVSAYRIFINSVQIMCPELPVFYRDYNEGLYGSDVYILARSLAELPIFLFVPSVFSAISWFMVGYSDELSRFLIFVLAMVLLCNVSVSLGELFSATGSMAGHAW